MGFGCSFKCQFFALILLPFWVGFAHFLGCPSPFSTNSLPIPFPWQVNLDLTSLLDGEDKKSKNKRGVLPKHATNIMRSWLFQHLMVSTTATKTPWKMGNKGQKVQKSSNPGGGLSGFVFGGAKGLVFWEYFGNDRCHCRWGKKKQTNLGGDSRAFWRWIIEHFFAVNSSKIPFSSKLECESCLTGRAVAHEQSVKTQNCKITPFWGIGDGR